MKNFLESVAKYNKNMTDDFKLQEEAIKKRFVNPIGKKEFLEDGKVVYYGFKQTELGKKQLQELKNQ